MKNHKNTRTTSLRRMCDIVVLLVLMLVACGCGGHVRTDEAFVRAVPRLDGSLERIASDLTADVYTNGIIKPVGVRGYGDDTIIVDVLLARPGHAIPSMMFRDVVECTYNTINVFEAARARGFRLSECDGRDLQIIRVSRGLEADPRFNGPNTRRFEHTSRKSIAGQRVDIAVVPIVIQCEKSISIGSCVCVRRTSRDDYFGMSASNAKWCGPVESVDAGTPNPIDGRWPGR